MKDDHTFDENGKKDKYGRKRIPHPGADFFLHFFFLGHFSSIITFANVLNKFGSISLAELPLIRLLFFIQSDILNSECPQFWFNIRNIIGNSEHCYSPTPETETLKDKIYQIMIVKIMILVVIILLPQKSNIALRKCSFIRN